MKVFLLVLFALLVGTLNAQNDGVGTIVGQWAGDTSTSSLTFRAPVNVPCNQAATATTYVAINTTFAVAGVREVALLAESSFKGAVTVYLYAGTFNPLTSCDSNFVRQLRNSNFGATSLIIDDPVFFEAGTNYIFVVSSTSTTNNGKFVLQVWGSVGGGSTTATSPTWNPSAYNNGCVLQTSINQTMGIVQWTQATTGNYDLIGMFDVAAATGAPSSSIYWTLYAGTFSAADIAANPCGTTIGTSFRTNANEGDRTAAAWNVQLTQNQPYTVAISNTYNGNFAFNVFPTRLARISSVAGFNQPETAPPCAASSNTDAPYYIYPIPSSAVTGPFYIVDTEELFAYLAPAYVNFDTRSFAYSGTVTAPPAACPAGNTFLGSADTGDTNGPLIFNTTAGQAYSVVVSDFTGAALTDANSAIYVWAFTGTPIGGAAATTGATTGAATTGATTAGTTGAATTGTANATTSAPTTSTTTTTSPASALAASAFLAFAGTLALLL